MKLSLKIVRKTKITFLLRKTFFFLNKSIYFLILGKVVFIIPKNSIALALFLPRQILKTQICLDIAECQGKFRTLLSDFTEPKYHKTKHQLVACLKPAISTFETEPQSHVLYYKVFFDKGLRKHPMQILWQELFKFPNPPFLKFENDSCIQQHKGGTDTVQEISLHG